MRSIVGFVLVVTLAACGGSGSSSSAKDAAKNVKPYVPPSSAATTSSSSSTTTKPRMPGSAVAIAKGLGCIDPKLEEANDGSFQTGLPDAVESVRCIAAGTEFSIDVYASHADLERVYSPAGQTIVCGYIKAFGVGTGPFYSVLGDDFEVEASAPTPQDGSIGELGTLEQAEALGRALDLPVHKFTCP